MTARFASVALVLVLLLGWTTAGSSPAAMAGRSAGQQAPGQPIIDCTGMQATAARLKAGLPVQEEWIRRTEAQLRAAEAGVVESKAELTDTALRAALQLISHQVEVMNKLQTEFEHIRGFSSIERHYALECFEEIKDTAAKVEGATTTLGASLDLGTAVRQNRTSLEKLARFLQDSGMGDEGAKVAATAMAGPVGGLVVESFAVSRDLIYAGLQGVMTAREAELARENLDKMRTAKSGVDARIAELEHYIALDCAAPAPEPKDRILVQSPAEPPALPPAEPASKSTATKGGKGGSGMSTATRVGLGLAGGLAAAGAAVAAGGAAEEEEAVSSVLKCTAQETLMSNAVIIMQNAANNLAACGSNTSCITSRLDAAKSAWSAAASAAGNWCTCMGSSYSSQLSASEKESVQWLWTVAPSLGLNAGTLPSCFR